MDTVSLIIVVALVAVVAFLSVKYYGRIAAYMAEVQKEMRKVNWPSRNELISNTVITLVATVIVSLFIFGVDRVISTVLDVIYS